MSTVLRLPNELAAFMARPAPQSLLIRGTPGAGKSTLGMALLEAFPGAKMLVTSRVGGDELRREFGWLGEAAASGIDIVDATASESSVQEAARAMRAARETLLAPETPTPEQDPASFLWLPSPVQEAWARLDPSRPTLVVLDSWEAIIEAYLGAPGEWGGRLPDRAYLERTLLARMGRTPVHLVLVLEREGPTALDYLVNGVVVARRDVEETRLARWLVIEKLRGVRIDNPAYPYTLEGGRFSSIQPARPYSVMRPGVPALDPDPRPGFLWPGAPDFAENFGRLPLGKITLIEVDLQASSAVPDLLTAPIIAHALRNGGRALVLPHTSETPAEVLQSLAPTVSEAEFLDRVRLVIPRGQEPAASDPLAPAVFPAVRLAPYPAADETAEAEAIRFLRESAAQRLSFLYDGVDPNTPSVIVTSLQGMGGVARAIGLRNPAAISETLPDVITDLVRGRPAHAVLVGRKGSVDLDPYRMIASVRISLSIRQGRIFLHGVYPWTEDLVLVDGDEETPYHLIRVV